MSNSTSEEQLLSSEKEGATLDTITISMIVVCVVVIPVLLICFGKLIERKYGYLHKAKAEANHHPIFDPKNN